ncbi:MAG: glycoside hydrolase family 2 protein [Phycisphaerales bacterium]|nr:glycoside hydrolase family 2 protein [Phycisphaerales bacterium]
MHQQCLDGDNWVLQAVGDLSHVPAHIRGKVFPARVPGCVHLDLIRAGVLRHPNLGYAERDQEWIGRTDWRYEHRFVVEPGSGIPAEARFECLDTIATIELNGREIGRASNFHHPHAFTVQGVVREGANSLGVTLAAPLAYVERAHAESGRLPYNGDFLGWAPFQMVRKPACNFRWDWGPAVPTSGIAGSVRLTTGEGGEPACGPPRIKRRTSSRWAVEVDVWRNPGSAAGSQEGSQEVSLRLTRDGVVVPGAQHEAGSVRDEAGAPERHRLLVECPELWWPRGFGERARYELHATVRASGKDLEYRWPVWFRSVELDSSPDNFGSAFAIRINGEPIFCRGANWIPDALFPTEATPERVRARVRQAADANMNMLRVWGGGLYEQDAFYDACDELGIMVWQDFMFACALYPESVIAGELPAEFSTQTDRLARHPSVVLWCGGNECVEGYQHWGWKDKVEAGTGWGIGIWCRDLPRMLEQADPTRPYWPNSPWSGLEAQGPEAERALAAGSILDVRDPDHGDRHTWDLHFEDVRKLVPRFVSEFGRVAPACERTLRDAEVFGDAVRPSWPREAPPLNDGVRAALEHRLRQTGGSKVAYDPVLPEQFRRPATDLRAWLWQTQVLQARALATHIEWLRANAPRCLGALIWQLNDCWACQSWSLIDFGGRPKPAWYAVRRAFAPRLFTIQPFGGDERLSAVLVNDTDDPVEGECRVRRMTFTGVELAAASAPLTAAPRSVARLDRLVDLVGEPGDRASEVLVAECAGERGIWFWARDLDLQLPAEPLAGARLNRDGRTLARLEARALARDVIIAADLLGPAARAADNCLTLLPGETLEIEIETPDPALLAAIPIPELIRSASGPCLDGPRAQTTDRSEPRA